MAGEQRNQDYPIRLDIRGPRVSALPARAPEESWGSAGVSAAAPGIMGLPLSIPGAGAAMAPGLTMAYALAKMQESGGEMPPSKYWWGDKDWRAPARAAPPPTPAVAATPAAEQASAAMLKDYLKSMTGKGVNQLSRADVNGLIGLMPAPRKPMSARDMAGYQAMATLSDPGYRARMQESTRITDKDERSAVQQAIRDQYTLEEFLRLAGVKPTAGEEIADYTR